LTGETSENKENTPEGEADLESSDVPLSPQSKQFAEKQYDEQQQKQLTPKSAWREEQKHDAETKQHAAASFAAKMEETNGQQQEGQEIQFVEDFTLYARPVVELVVRVLADYDKRDESEMSIYEGEMIHVIRQDSSGWWEGRREGDDEVGWFPSSYGEAYHEIWSIQESEENDEDSAF
jgi:hypothetical protein